MPIDKIPATKNVLLFIPKGAEELEISTFTDVMGWCRKYSNVEIVKRYMRIS